VRLDFDIIKHWIKPDTRVLDLGCGDGTLLALLKESDNIEPLGIEIDSDAITSCIAKDIPVIEQDLNYKLSNFETGSFDFVIMTQSLQTLNSPHIVLDEMLRIGKESIITFPNFGHWRARLHLITKGTMPVSKDLPFAWYETPNIHFCTVNDFEALCKEKGLRILNRTIVNRRNSPGLLAKQWPNMFGMTALYHISR